MKVEIGRTEKILLAIGLLLIGVTFALNERIVAGIFPVYQGSAPTEVKIGIFILDVLFAVTIVFVLVYRQPKVRVLKDALIGIGFAALLLVGIEIVFYLLNTKNQVSLEPVQLDFIDKNHNRNVDFKGAYNQAFFQRDDWMGYTLVPNTQVIASRVKGDEVLYQALYSVDEYGRRVIPLDHTEHRPRFILFFGGSYTFAEGVNDDETMPYYVSKLASKYRGYNYGVPGYGPQHMLAKLQNSGITTEINETEGILIYTFINEHIGRAIGSMGIHNNRGDVMPYYFIASNGELIRNGNFVSGRPIFSLFYSIAGQSQTLKYFHIGFPLHYREQDFKTTVEILKEARNEYQNKFVDQEFYILIYPGLGIPEFLPYLEAADLPYLDYSNLPYVHDEEFWIGEGHPTAKAHKIVAEKLVQDLHLLR